jgi:hypothetical protein
LLPSLFSVAVTLFDDFGVASFCLGAWAVLSGFLLLRTIKQSKLSSKE